VYVRFEELEALRHHARDGVLLSVEQNLAADDRALATEAVAPERVAEYDDAFGAGLLFVGGEGAAERGGRAE
jgi:hypothetical protein